MYLRFVLHCTLLHMIWEFLYEFCIFDWSLYLAFQYVRSLANSLYSHRRIICGWKCSAVKKVNIVAPDSQNEAQELPEGQGWYRKLFETKIHILQDCCRLMHWHFTLGAPGSAVGWDTALQVGRSRARFPMLALEFFFDIILPAVLWPWGRLNL